MVSQRTHGTGASAAEVATKKVAKHVPKHTGNISDSPLILENINIDSMKNIAANCGIRLGTDDQTIATNVSLIKAKDLAQLAQWKAKEKKRDQERSKEDVHNGMTSDAQVLELPEIIEGGMRVETLTKDRAQEKTPPL